MQAGNLRAMFSTVSPKLAEATVANKFAAKNYHQNIHRGFHSRCQTRGFQAGNLGATFAPYCPNSVKLLLRRGTPQKIIIKAPVGASIRDLRAEIFKQVTWEQRLQPYGANLLKPPLRTDSPPKIIIKAPVGAFIRDFRTEVFKQVT